MAESRHPVTVQNARRLRKPLTPLEAMLWRRLRGGQIGGFKFRRQHVIGPYIVDFCCAEVGLVIEVDGDSHTEQEEYDEERTNYLKYLGHSVIRFTNRDVLHNMDGVLEVILAE